MKTEIYEKLYKTNLSFHPNFVLLSSQYRKTKNIKDNN